MNRRLGERELDIMGVLWRTGPGTAAEVQDRLDAGLAYNTVSTILRNLETKGFVGHTAEGRLFTYHPLVSEQAVRRSMVSRMVDKLFRGSPLSVVTHLVEQEALTREELESLHELLETQLRADAEGERPGKGSPPGRQTGRKDARSGRSREEG